MSLEIVPMTLRESRAFVGEHHRHHEPPSALLVAVSRVPPRDDLEHRPRGGVRVLPLCDGAVRVNPRNRNTAEMFWSRVTKESGDRCWLRPQGKTRGGYGTVNFGGRKWRARRLAWTLAMNKLSDRQRRCEEPNGMGENVHYCSRCLANALDEAEAQGL